MAPSVDDQMVECCLKSLRGPRSKCQPPNLQGSTPRTQAQLLSLLDEIILSTRFCLALLEDLPALSTSGIHHQEPAFKRLEQEHCSLYEAVQGYIVWIFEPGAALAQAEIEGSTEQEKIKSVQTALDGLEKHTSNLQSKLRKTHGLQTADELRATGEMPSRSPWVQSLRAHRI